MTCGRELERGGSCDQPKCLENMERSRRRMGFPDRAIAGEIVGFDPADAGGSHTVIVLGDEIIDIRESIADVARRHNVAPADLRRAIRRILDDDDRAGV
jgi:hypothetical protein